MIKNILLSTTMLMSGIGITNTSEVVPNEYEIVLTDEDSFHPTMNYLDEDSDSIYGTVADDDSKYNDGSNRYTSFYNEGNSEFVFALPQNYSQVSINTDIKVSGVYDQYYSVVEVVVPVGGDTLVRSQEIFHLEGTVTPGDTEGVVIAEGQVVTIVDRWFSDDLGYADVVWKMKLNEFGNQLTIWCEGYETGDIWATASPIWAISEFTTATTSDEEYHDKEGNGTTWFEHYSFQTPESYSDNTLHLVVVE